jgi:hypothetical protein
MLYSDIISLLQGHTKQYKISVVELIEILDQNRKYWQFGQEIH